jgi:hypothetical protein
MEAKNDLERGSKRIRKEEMEVMSLPDRRYDLEQTRIIKRHQAKEFSENSLLVKCVMLLL